MHMYVIAQDVSLTAITVFKDCKRGISQQFSVIIKFFTDL